MNKINRIKELVDVLHKASIAYYKDDNPIMSDKQYDDLYDELELLEKETGLILAGSPTQKVQGYVLDGFKKVQHSKPMLSVAKTKDIDEIKRFVKDKDFYCSYKLDGLTTVVKYENSKFAQGITRGTGEIGEDVTEQCKFIPNLPMIIPTNEYVELRGETVVSYDEFHRVNFSLDKPFSHPRNMAAGTLRNLDLNVVKQRRLSFVVFEVVSPIFKNKVVSPIFKNKWEGLEAVREWGFEVVNCGRGSVDDLVEAMQPEFYKYPVDGLVFEINDYDLSKSMGATQHHEGCRIALKWADDLYETTLTGIEWQTSRTGLINPVAVFSPVDLSGAITTRATLHNLSYIEDLEMGVGDTIQIYRANMVVPKVHDNLTRSNTWTYPKACPTCGYPTEVHNENGSKTLHCTNPACKAKLINRLVNFVSRKCMNIDGLSEETLTKFVEWGWIKNLFDVYNLTQYFSELKHKEGFGARSVKKLQDAIENSKNVELDHFIAALSIPGIGSAQAKELAKKFKTWETFEDAGYGNFDFSKLDSFGAVSNRNIHQWFRTMYHEDRISQLVRNLKFIGENDTNKDERLAGLTFVITGSLHHFENRDALKRELESRGAKVSGSVSAKTSYLINNDIDSTSSKNKKAKQLNIPIVNEEYIIGMLSQ